MRAWLVMTRDADRSVLASSEGGECMVCMVCIVCVGASRLPCMVFRTGRSSKPRNKKLAKLDRTPITSKAYPVVYPGPIPADNAHSVRVARVCIQIVGSLRLSVFARINLTND